MSWDDIGVYKYEIYLKMACYILSTTSLVSLLKKSVQNRKIYQILLLIFLWVLKIVVCVVNISMDSDYNQ